MPLRRHRKTSFVALAVSLGLHLALMLWLWGHRASPTRPPSGSQVIELTVIETPAAKPPPKPQTTAPAAPRAATAKRSTQSAAAAPARAQASTPSTPGPSGHSGTPQDAPRLLTLTPGAGFAVRLPGSERDEQPRGHTEHNSPDERPDPVVMNEYRAEKAQRSVQNLAENLVGATRSGPGLLDPYFTTALKAVRSEVDAVGPPVPKNTGPENFAQAIGPWQAPASRFGATGNPFPEGEKSAEASATPLGRTAMGAGNGVGGVNDTGFARQLAAGQQFIATGELMMAEVHKAKLVTVLELFQVHDGALADATIISSSGFPDFDEYALHRARLAFRKLEEAPASGMGISPEGWRSVWRFSFTPPTVRVELLRVVKGAKKNPFDKTVE